MSFSITLTTVIVMLLYAIPGFLLVKFRKVPQSAISAFATFLVYICAPFQIVYAMQQIEYSPYMAKYLGIALAVSLVTMAGMVLLMSVLLRKKLSEPPYRVCACAASLGNVGFMG